MSENTQGEQKQASTPIKVWTVVVTPFQQNCTLFLCTKTNKLAIIDPGGDADRIKAAVAETGGEPEKVLITHGHIDHVGAVVDIAAHYGIPVEGPHRDDVPLLERVATQAAMFGVDEIPVPKPDRWLEDGDHVEVGARRLDVLHTPGHAPGHVVFFDPELRFGIFGDVLFRGSVGRTDLPGGDHATLMRSIFQKLLPLGDDVLFLCGHGPASTIGQERQTNPFITGGFSGD
ncbi:MAG: MBL fold metallo-hydrolase [Hyphomicrobiaceae bacterium]|nr:MBL fold metallo-hydrolase [Hyphomicrobiaceae bacterium]